IGRTGARGHGVGHARLDAGAHLGRIAVVAPAASLVAIGRPTGDPSRTEHVVAESLAQLALALGRRAFLGGSLLGGGLAGGFLFGFLLGGRFFGGSLARGLFLGLFLRGGFLGCGFLRGGLFSGRLLGSCLFRSRLLGRCLALGLFFGQRSEERRVGIG